VAANLFARVNDPAHRKILRQEAGRLLLEGSGTAILRRKE
jgi:hypothetical protein